MLRASERANNEEVRKGAREREVKEKEEKKCKEIGSLCTPKGRRNKDYYYY